MFKLKFKSWIYNIICDIIVFCILIFMMVKVGQINENKIIKNAYFTDLIENWTNKPIKELYLADNGESCQKDFLNYTWEGVPFTCDCKSSNNGSVKGSLFHGKCSILNSLLGCQTIKKINNQKISKWKNAKICIREHEVDYSMTLTILGNKCPKKYLLCGTDTKGFSICFPKNYGCPVNHIKFSNTERKTSEKITHTLKLNDDWYIHYSNKFTNNSIFVDVKYTEGRMCINPNEANIKNTYLKYKKTQKEIETEKEKEKLKLHLYCTTKIGKNNFDERYILLDSNSKFKFFTDNRITNVIEKLPHVNSQDLISQTSNLYFRSYIHWSPFCKQDESLNQETMLNDFYKLLVIDDFYVFIEIYFFYLFAVNLIQLLINSIILFSEIKYNSSFSQLQEAFPSNNIINYKVEEKDIMIKDNNKTIECETMNDKNMFKKRLIFIEFIRIYFRKISFYIMHGMIMFSIALISAFLFNIYLSEKNTNIIERFISQKCGDLITNETFNQIGNRVNFIILNNYQNLLFSIILCGFLLFKTVI